MKRLNPLFYYFLTAALYVFPPPLPAEEAFDLEFFADGLTDVGDAANEAKKKADELGNRIKELNKNAQQAVQTFKHFVFEQKA